MKLWHRLNAIYAREDIDGSAKAVAAYLAFRVDEHTLSWRIGAGRIADDVGLTRRNVQYAIDRLEQAGVIHVQRSGKHKGRNAANIYTLMITRADTEIASQRRYSQKKNSVATAPRIASQQQLNSVVSTHQPSEPIYNRTAAAGCAPESAPPAAVPEQKSVTPQNRARLLLARPHTPRYVSQATGLPLEEVLRLKSERIAH